MLIYRQGLEIHGAAGDPEEESRYNLSAIQIHPDGRVVATDGKQFCRMPAAVSEPDLFTETEVGTVVGGDLEEPVTIPADVAKAFLAASKRKTNKGKKAQMSDGAILTPDPPTEPAPPTDFLGVLHEGLVQVAAGDPTASAAAQTFVTGAQRLCTRAGGVDSVTLTVPGQPPVTIDQRGIRADGRE